MCNPDFFPYWYGIFRLCEEAVLTAPENLCARVLSCATGTCWGLWKRPQAMKETWCTPVQPTTYLTSLASCSSLPLWLRRQPINWIFHQKWRTGVLIIGVGKAKTIMGMWGNCLRFKLCGGQAHLSTSKFPWNSQPKCHKHNCVRASFLIRIVDGSDWMLKISKGERGRSFVHKQKKWAQLRKVYSQHGKELEKHKALLSLVRVCSWRGGCSNRHQCLTYRVNDQCYVMWLHCSWKMLCVFILEGNAGLCS